MIELIGKKPAFWRNSAPAGGKGDFYGSQSRFTFKIEKAL